MPLLPPLFAFVGYQSILLIVGGAELNPQLGRNLNPAENVSLDFTPTLDTPAPVSNLLCNFLIVDVSDQINPNSAWRLLKSDTNSLLETC